MTRQELSRRTLLAGAGGAAALALGANDLRSPAGAHALTGPVSQLSRADGAFLRDGLIHAAWLRSGSADGWIPSIKQWSDVGLTTPQYYGEMIADSALHKLEYSGELMQGNEDQTWALARAPFPKALFNPAALPDPTADWMTPAMKQADSKLFSTCFGDEEEFSEPLLDYYTRAYQQMRRTHPDVLLHNNQALGQYGGDRLSRYVQVAKPDMITWDWYIWERARFYPGGSITGLYNTAGRYRSVALAGLDGTGQQPINFGQYTVGFRLAPPPLFEGDKVMFRREVYISQSQLNIVPYLTWAMGGKWLSMFRWELDEDYTHVDGRHWETDGLFLTDAEENPLPAYHWYTQISESRRAFSPYLVRLRSKAVARVAGRTAAGAVTPATSGIAAFTPALDPESGVVGISAVNVGTANSGQPGDVVVGTFTEIPGLSVQENAAVLPDREHARAFMLVNAMAHYNDDYRDPHSTGGSGADCRQEITVTVTSLGRTLYRIQEGSPRPVEVPISRSAGVEQFTVRIDGGAGALFIWG